MKITSLKLRRNLLFILFGSAVLLITIHIVFNNKISLSGSDDKEINIEEISQRFKNILLSFGIEDKMLKESYSKDQVSGLKVPKYRIQVPKDLSIPEILKDVFNTFREDSLEIESIEKVKGGKSVLVLKSGNADVLISEFEYSKNISREKKYFALLIRDLEFDSLEDSILIESSTALNILIRPNSKFIGHINHIKDNRKEFSLLIDDEIEEQKYKLGKRYSEQRIINVLKTLITDFSNASFIVVNDNSEFYNSANYKLFADALAKRKIRIFHLSDFINLTESESLVIDFDRRMERPNNNGLNVFLLNKETYELINPEMHKYYKKGYRIINCSLLTDNLYSSAISD